MFENHQRIGRAGILNANTGPGRVCDYEQFVLRHLSKTNHGRGRYIVAVRFGDTVSSFAE